LLRVCNVHKRSPGDQSRHGRLHDRGARARRRPSGLRVRDRMPDSWALALCGR
jgi:hypothetical protein